MVSHTYCTRNNLQPTISLPPSQPVLPSPPCHSQNLGLDYDLVLQLRNNPTKISLC